jgi:hypothetical protein
MDHNASPMNRAETDKGEGVAADPRFDFYEKVIVGSTNPALSGVNGELGAVLGRACGEDGCWSYAVSLDRTGRSWSCMEGDCRV